MKHIFISGASGFIGEELARHFLEKGYNVSGVGTSAAHPLTQMYEKFSWISADTTEPGEWQAVASKADIVINLAGRTIFHLWTQKYKEQIYDSRIKTTKNIVDAVSRGNCELFVSTSAVGIYGDRGDETLEETADIGEGFLADVCRDWESEAGKASLSGIRTCIMRLGVVLGNKGALAKMMPAFKSFVGGPLGSGQHFFPWVHIRDIINTVELFSQSDLEGAFNLVGPETIRQKEFAKALGNALGRPSFLPVPAFVVKIVMGELGRSLLQSQKAIPKNLLESGFEFEFKSIGTALEDIV